MCNHTPNQARALRLEELPWAANPSKGRGPKCRPPADPLLQAGPTQQTPSGESPFIPSLSLICDQIWSLQPGPVGVTRLKPNITCLRSDTSQHWRALIPAGAGAPAMDEIVHSGHIRLGNIDL